MESNQISIRVAGASGSGKQQIVNFIMQAFRVAGNTVGTQMEGSLPLAGGNVPYDIFNVSCSSDAKGDNKWGLSKNYEVRVPSDLLVPRLSKALAKQGFTTMVERHPLIDEFLSSIGDDFSGNLKNDGSEFEGDRAKHLFEGFCMGRGHKQ